MPFEDTSPGGILIFLIAFFDEKGKKTSSIGAGLNHATATSIVTPFTAAHTAVAAFTSLIVITSPAAIATLVLEEY